MPAWIIYAIVAAIFAGVTAALTKFGIEKVNADLGLAIRTAVLFLISCINLLAWKGHKDISLLTLKSLFVLCLTGVTTGICWIFYYKAMKSGDISTITAIDRGSVLITILLSVSFLNEPITSKLLTGTGFILIGVIILIWQK